MRTAIIDALEARYEAQILEAGGRLDARDLLRNPHAVPLQVPHGGGGGYTY